MLAKNVFSMFACASEAIVMGTLPSSPHSAKDQVFGSSLACFMLQVYIPDDDIIQLSSSISEIFNIQERYSLELAQPSLCSNVESHTIHVTGLPLWKEATTVLRYGTFVEIMVPLFSMTFFNREVVKTLSTSASGMSCHTCMYCIS